MIRSECTDENSNRGALARAVRSDKTEYLTRLEVQIDIPELEEAKRFRDASHQDGFRHTCFSKSRCAFRRRRVRSSNDNPRTRARPTAAVRWISSSSSWRLSGRTGLRATKEPLP